MYLQQGAMIVHRNLLRDESLAPEKLCTVLFGRNRLKITVKRHTRLATCANITLATCGRAPQNLKPQAGD